MKKAFSSFVRLDNPPTGVKLFGAQWQPRRQALVQRRLHLQPHAHPELLL